MGKSGEEFYGEFVSDRQKNSSFPHFSHWFPGPLDGKIWHRIR